jgi:WD40 repeat protein
VLQQRVKELAGRVKVLTVENEALKAEVEMYRKEAASRGPASGESGSSLAGSAHDADDDGGGGDDDAFVVSGNGVYPRRKEATLSRLHGSANPLCAALSSDDTVLATGGADRSWRLTQWGAAAAADAEEGEEVPVTAAASISCEAPVICTAFSPVVKGVCAAGTMDGSVLLASYETTGGRLSMHAAAATTTKDHKHGKYVLAVAWSPTEPLVASASADGTVHVYRVSKEMKFDTGDMRPVVTSSVVQTLHLPGAVETVTFTQDNKLLCYARGSPYLHSFDLGKEFAVERIRLNDATAGFGDHVSFAVMDLSVSPAHEKYVACATDTSRNMVLDLRTGRQVRNCYGHRNDGFSQPAVAWSLSGQYLLGNTQDESAVVVWDVASSKIVERLSDHHTSPIKDLYSSPTTNTLVTTAFDKHTHIWMAPV